jgi:hypothetical protein
MYNAAELHINTIRRDRIYLQQHLSRSSSFVFKQKGDTSSSDPRVEAG